MNSSCLQISWTSDKSSKAKDFPDNTERATCIDLYDTCTAFMVILNRSTMRSRYEDKSSFFQKQYHYMRQYEVSSNPTEECSVFEGFLGGLSLCINIVRTNSPVACAACDILNTKSGVVVASQVSFIFIDQSC